MAADILDWYRRTENYALRYLLLPCLQHCILVRYPRIFKFGTSNSQESGVMTRVVRQPIDLWACMSSLSRDEAISAIIERVLPKPISFY